jgi:hypothetical protein
VKGEELLEATLSRRPRGEGVRGMRPPAILVEKIPWWVFTGVETRGVAILK